VRHSTTATQSQATSSLLEEGLFLGVLKSNHLWHCPPQRQNTLQPLMLQKRHSGYACSWQKLHGHSGSLSHSIVTTSLPYQSAKMTSSMPGQNTSTSGTTLSVTLWNVASSPSTTAPPMTCLPTCLPRHCPNHSLHTCATRLDYVRLKGECCGNSISKPGTYYTVSGMARDTSVNCPVH
jgi:hypothetical protein